MLESVNRASAGGRSGGPEPRRLGKNAGGYRGETIDVKTVLADCVGAARAHGWSVEPLGAGSELLFAFTRVAGPASGDTGDDGAGEVRSQTGRRRVYISTGIHGDEPAGPLAVRQLLRENLWPERLDIWLCPCLNPEGFVANRRENTQGMDLNRQYREPKAAETAAHIAWLERQPRFDAGLCLHEDWESQGFYVYELNPDSQPSLAEAIVARVAEVCLLDPSEVIEGRAASGGIIRPSLDPRLRPQWPEAFYLLTHKTRLSCTLEAPSDFALGVRVAALVAGVGAALELLT